VLRECARDRCWPSAIQQEKSIPGAEPVVDRETGQHSDDEDCAGFYIFRDFS
jgi:hypothetical protein